MSNRLFFNSRGEARTLAELGGDMSPNVAIEFARQIFPPEVQQSMVGRQDFEVFRKGVNGAVKGLYTAYEIGMCLHAIRRDIEQRDECIQKLKAHAEKAERELRKIKSAESQSASHPNLVVEERVTQRLISDAIADRNTASMFAIKTARAAAYEKGFHDGRKVRIQKTKEKLAKEVCRCENRGFRHGWIKALQEVEALQAASVNSALSLYQ